MAGETLSDADARYLARIAADCEERLGPGTVLLGVERDAVPEGIRLLARYRLGENERESAAIGETMLAAHERLRARILIDRVRFGFVDLVEHG